MTTAHMSSFFKESTSSLGLFYPTHYIVTVFPTPSAAEEAYRALQKSGIAEDEMLAPPAEEALTFLQEFRDQSGVVGGAMRGLSRFLGDDATFTDRDMEHAKMRAGFLFVHSETDESTARIQNVAEPFGPVTMRWYLPSGIQSLV